MAEELWKFFLKKLRKGNGVWWALLYTKDHRAWLRLNRRHDRHSGSLADCTVCGWGEKGN